MKDEITAPPPFPTTAVLGAALALFTNAFALFSVVPYAGYMATWLGVARTKEESGFYAGWLVSGFMFGRASTSVLWGGLSDRIGRKPVLIVGCAAMIVGQLVFGLARSFPLAVASRVLLGVFNGLVGAAKTVASELVPSEATGQQQRAMSIISAGVSLASLLGPACGGFLADPAHQVGGVFDSPFFRAYPYALPNLVGAAFALASLVWIVLYVPETREGAVEMRLCCLRCPRRSSSRSRRWVAVVEEEEEGDIELAEVSLDEDLEDEEMTAAALHAAPSLPPPVPVPALPPKQRRCSAVGAECVRAAREVRATIQLLSKRKIACAIFTYAAISFIAIYQSEMTPLWLIASPSVGGLAWSPALIGAVATVTGATMLFYQLLVFPFIAARAGPCRLIVFSCLLQAPAVFLLPLTSPLALALGMPTRGGAMIVIVAVLRIIIELGKMTSFTCVFLLINNSIASSQRGAVNGLAMTVASVTKAAGPVCGAEIFAWTISSAAQSLGSLRHCIAFVLNGGAWVVCAFVVAIAVPRSLDVAYAVATAKQDDNDSHVVQRNKLSRSPEEEGERRHA